MSTGSNEEGRARAAGTGGPVVRSARFLGSHLGSFPAKAAVFLGAGFAVATVAAILFAWLAWGVLEGWTQGVDVWVLEALAARRSPALTTLALEVTTLGNGVVLAMVLAVSSLFLWLTHHRWSVVLLLVGAGLGSVANLLLKDIFDRERPSVVEAMAEVQTDSFPSGHAMASLLVYGSVAFLVGRIQPGSRLRRVTWALAAVLILLIGFSRIYLSVHYPSDVVAGFVAGVAWLAFVIVGIDGIRELARQHPEVAEHEHDLQPERGAARSEEE